MALTWYRHFQRSGGPNQNGHLGGNLDLNTKERLLWIVSTHYWGDNFGCILDARRRCVFDLSYITSR
jgi:hypothetical protein